jgi:hypothetical protein
MATCRWGRCVCVGGAETPKNGEASSACLVAIRFETMPIRARPVASARHAAQAPGGERELRWAGLFCAGVAGW